jgi:endonuclease/exonuclease/phosphatase (EEP) superfamily protein YafD
MIFTGAFSAPAFSTTARRLASLASLDPVIWEEPPVIFDCTTGAE